MLKERLQSVRSLAGRLSVLQVLVALVTVSVGVGYIWEVNQSATAGFTMRELNNSIEDLTLEQERLDLQVARLQSIDSVTTRVQMLGMKEVGNIEYITPGGDTVALNR